MDSATLVAVFQQDFNLKVSKVEAIRFAKKFWILGGVLFPRGKRKTLYTTHMYVYIYIWGSYIYIYIRTYSSNMSASTCIHFQQKHVFLYINLVRNCHKNTNQHLASSASTTRTATPLFQDTVGSIATHTKGGKESAQNEPGGVPATYRRGGWRFPAVVKLCIFRTFHEKTWWKSLSEDLALWVFESIGICCWNQ